MAALRTVPDNLSELGGALADPLGVGVDDYEDLANAADAQSVRVGTLDALQRLFDGQLGAFSYLLFVLLYMPCVATIGVIVKELGSFWAIFSTSWSVVMAYTCAVLCYQLGSIAVDPVSSLAWSAGVTLAAAGMFFALIKFGQRHAPPLIPLVNLE